MAEFEVYNGVVQHSPMSCGAYCINAGLTELGLDATAADANKLNTADMKNGYDGLFGKARINLWRVKHFVYERLQVAAEVGKKTYSVTGNLELRMGSGEAVYLESSACTDLENSPSGMVEVAAKTCPTLSKNITYYTTAGKKEFDRLALMNAGPLSNLFDSEKDLIENKIKKQVTLSGVTEIPFQKKQVNVILVRYKDTKTMHWIAGTLDVNNARNAVIYDPATGDVLTIPTANNFELQTQNAKPATKIGPNSYEFPGIWIRLEA